MKYSLKSTDLFHLPGMIAWWKNVYRTDRHLATLQVAYGLSELPALAIDDLLAGRIEPTITADAAVEFEWDKPLGTWEDYHGSDETRLAQASNVIRAIAENIANDPDGLNENQYRRHLRIIGDLREELAECARTFAQHTSHLSPSSTRTALATHDLG